MKKKVYTLDSFALEPGGGNPAGVVLDSDDLTADQMLAVAKKIGFSETAFVQESDKADFKVRFFTTTGEVSLCGHATIATFSVLKKLNRVLLGSSSQETRSGVLPIQVQDRLIFTEQSKPVFSEIIPKTVITQSLGLDVLDIDDDLPIQVVSTGGRDIMIPVRSQKILRSITPDFKAIVDITEKYNAIGFHVFSLSETENTTAFCRDFAPAYGIEEEAATGTACGALGAYLLKHDMVSEQEAARGMIFQQGEDLGRPSVLQVHVNTDEKDTWKVLVGGETSNIQEKDVEI